MKAEERPHTNRLIHESSPYLRQHAHNPVDWYPWGTEALAKARTENRPIFLSIGYAACHWCHVMERESFENDAIAALLNRHFVAIKVDREERPDLDEVYMTAVQLMTGSGGWPLSVFLTPALEPFYGGTYFPPEDMFGRPGFGTVLERLAEAWQGQQEMLRANAADWAGLVRRTAGLPGSTHAALETDALVRAADALRNGYDTVYGGFGPAPKFPSAQAMAVLLRAHYRTGASAYLDMATTTLQCMADGGVYDHLGGGFHRYAVDAAWLVPHFEKMLYDNAQLASAYLEAYQVTHDPGFRDVAQDTLDYLLRDMSDPAGGFHATEDADSEGEEGKYYLWTRDEVLAVLGPEDGPLFCRYYDVREAGNFDSQEPYHAHANILHAPRPLDAVADEAGVTPEAAAQTLAACRAKLLERRAHRTRPGRDDKVLTAWNALAIAALAQGYQVLGDARYRDAAVHAATFLMTTMRRDGQLLHVYRAGEARLPGYLDDYAFTAAAFVDLYEATFDLRWLVDAERLAQEMLTTFWDPSAGAFFFASATHTDLIARTKPLYDAATPSANAMAVLGLLRLGALLGKPEYRDRAQRVLEIAQPMFDRAPAGLLTMACSADFFQHAPSEVVLVGSQKDAGMQALLDALHHRFTPGTVVALLDPAPPDATPQVQALPLFEDRTLAAGQPAAYVCHDSTCGLPVTTPEALVAALDAASTASRGR